jgi:hypothetical protein
MPSRRRTKTGDGTFLATIYRIWMLRYVDVPQNIVSMLTKEMAKAKPLPTQSRPKYIPVLATVNHNCVQTTLSPAGGGRYRLQFNAVLRKAAKGVDVGDVVGMSLALDTASRDLPMPRDLRIALLEHPKARKAFESAPPGYRRQILKWMDAAKSQAARGRRIEIVMDRMLERALLGPARRRKE